MHTYTDARVRSTQNAIQCLEVSYARRDERLYGCDGEYTRLVEHMCRCRCVVAHYLCNTVAVFVRALCVCIVSLLASVCVAEIN